MWGCRVIVELDKGSVSGAVGMMPSQGRFKGGWEERRGGNHCRFVFQGVLL